MIHTLFLRLRHWWLGILHGQKVRRNGQPQENLCSSCCTDSEAILTHSSSLNCSVIFSAQFFDAVFYMF
jgi:hypothetical protein